MTSPDSAPPNVLNSDAPHRSIERECQYCGKIVRGNSFPLHEKSCAIRLDPAIGRSVILASIEQNNQSGCWEWTGALNPDGYGLFNKTRAHRLSYSVFVGAISKVDCVLHRCDNPRLLQSEASVRRHEGRQQSRYEREGASTIRRPSLRRRAACQIEINPRRCHRYSRQPSNQPGFGYAIWCIA